MAEDTGTEVLDRGDDVEDKLPPSTIDDSKPELDKDSDTVEQSTEEIEAEKLAEEKPRDEGGKFAKKDREDKPVPVERHKQILEKERAAREAAEARAEQAEALVRKEERSVNVQKFEEHIEELEKTHAGLLLDGESEKAAAVMKQIRQAVRQMDKIENDEKLTAATTAAVEQVRFEAVVAKFEAQYAFFNPDSEEFDADLVDLVIAESNRLQRVNGMPGSKSLETAALKVLAKFAPTEESTSKGLGAAKGADRKAEQVAKNLDTAKRQPASMKGVGKDSDKGGEGAVNIASMSQAEINALPESTKAKLRGDFL